jgi:hypothetical protein
MIIQINDKDQVIAFFTEDILKADNKTTFKVPEVKGFRKGYDTYYNRELNKVYFKKSQVDLEKQKAAKAKAEQIKKAVSQKEAALQWLADNDWKINKHTVGEWTEDDPRWLEYLTGRAKARAQYDEAVAILTQK